MALADRIYELFHKPTYELRIGGVLINSWATIDGTPCRVFSLRGGEQYDEESRIASPPWLEIEVSRIANGMRKGMSVTLDAGYWGEHVRIFTGGVWNLGEEDSDYLRTQCIGTGATAADGSRIEATATVLGGPAIWPPIPSGQQIDFGVDNHLAWTTAKLEEVVVREASDRNRIPRRPNDSKERQTIYCKGDLYGAMRDFKIPARDLSGLTVKASVEGILDDSGIASRNISIGTFTLAPDGATLDRMAGAGMLTPILQLQGAGVRQLPSGLVIGRVLSKQPSPTAAFQYSTNDQQYARIIRADPPFLVVPFNPLAQIWQTLGLALDYLGIDGRFWLSGHDWEITDGGALSYFDLRGGDQFGVSIGINPTASFTYAVATQVIGDELYYTITFMDTSTDSDGSIDQSASTWASNQTTIPNINTFDGEPVATIRIAVADVAGDFIVTRHVEDDDGLEDDFPGTLDLSAFSSAVTVPPFYVAAGTRRMATPDGAQTWHDTTPASKTATAIGARLADGLNSGHAVYGHSNGSLDLTLDANVTIAVALAAVSPATSFVNVDWDWRDHRFVWAVTADGRIYVSTDYGVSFFLLHNMRTVTYGGFGGTTPLAIGSFLGQPSGGGLYFHGGDGAGRPLIAYNVNPFGGPGNVWIRVTHLGDLLTDLATPADATMRVVALAAPGYGGDTYILEWASGGVGSLVAIYHTNDPPGPARSFTRATGLTAGLKNGRVMMESGPLSPRHRIALFGDDDTWGSADGIAWTLIGVANLPAGYTPNHGLFVSSTLGGMANIYEHMLAVENAAGDGGVMKSTDEGDTWNFVRPATGFPAWPAGAKAKKIAIGAPISTTPAGLSRLSAVTIGASPRRITDLTTEWSALQDITGVTSTDPRNFPISDTLRFVSAEANNTPTLGGGLYRSTDGGQTWALSLAEGVAVCRAANGWLWAIARTAGAPFGSTSQTMIHKSIDDGANWTLDETIGDGATVSRQGWFIAAHPSNANIIGVIGTGNKFMAVTADATATTPTWTTSTTIGAAFGQAGPNYAGFAILANGRFIVAGITSGGSPSYRIQTSDNPTVASPTWTVSYTLAATGFEFRALGVDPFLGKVMFIKHNTTANPDETKIVLSTDGATSFAELAVDTLETFCGDATTTIEGMAYDPITDSLYLAVTGAAGFAVVKFSPVTTAGRWYNVQLNLADTTFGDNPIAVIP